MPGSYPQIARVLDGARRREAWIVLGTAAGWGLAASLLALLLGALSLAAWPARAPGLRLATLGAAAIAVVAAAAWAALMLVRRASSPEAVARTVAADEPALRSDLVSAVELARDREDIAADGRYSVALLDAHLDDTARRLEVVRLRDAIPSLPARRALEALALAAAVHLVGLAAGFRPLAAGWALLVARGPAALVARADPITGDVELTFRYPAYMSRPPRTLSGTSGEVSAPRGTEVTLRTRADRDLLEAELVVEESGKETVGTAQRPSAPGAGAAQRLIPLAVANRRDLAAGFLVDAPGSYHFRFKKGRRVVAEGPPIPITVEPDAFPEVRITAPAQELEVRTTDPLRVDWSASDDYGLADLALVTKLPAGDEVRKPLRQFSETRREGGSFLLDPAAYKLGEGEKLLYWLEVKDNDAVSGPKRAASATHAVKLYSEAEHHRALLEQAHALWEQLVGLLGDRLAFQGGEERPWTDSRIAQALALDARARKLHQDLRDAAAAMKKEKAAPRELPAALSNLASGLRAAEQQVTALHQTLSRMLQFAPGSDAQLFRRVADLDGLMDRELEKDILYLEQLLDRRRAEDLLHLAKDLAARRRDLAALLEQYKQSPSEQGKKQLLAELSRMRRRMQEMAQRMAELAKGINDEHMNAEALAELSKSRDLAGGMDQVEKLLARGDLEGAMKALDAMGSTMQEMLAGLERTAGEPGRKNAGLMKEMLAFKEQLEQVRAEQGKVAEETGAVRQQYRKKLAEKLASLKEQTTRLRQLADEARREVEAARQAAPQRPDDDALQARDRLGDAARALGMQDLDAALDSARRATAPLQRLAISLENEARFPGRAQLFAPSEERQHLEQASRHAMKALPLARELRQRLEQLFPDPKGLLGPRQQEQLQELSQKQNALQQRAGELRQKLSQLEEKAPVFPPDADQQMSEAQGEMMQAAGELGARNPQRGHGHQRQAMESLDRFQKGLEQVAKNAQGGSGDGFPFPFGERQPGNGQGDGEEAPSPEKVEIPGAEAYQAPAEFRKDLLDAMKQGAPETYQGEVKRYYQELVK